MNQNPAFSNSSGLKRVFEKLRFHGGLVWMVGLTVEAKMHFQSLRLSVDAATVTHVAIFFIKEILVIRHESKFYKAFFQLLSQIKPYQIPNFQRSQPPENIECVTSLLAQYKRLLTNI